jgi:hypothetical protein
LCDSSANEDRPHQQTTENTRRKVGSLDLLLGRRHKMAEVLPPRSSMRRLISARSSLFGFFCGRFGGRSRGGGTLHGLLAVRFGARACVGTRTRALSVRRRKVMRRFKITSAVSCGASRGREWFSFFAAMSASVARSPASIGAKQIVECGGLVGRELVLARQHELELKSETFVNKT